MYKRQSICLGPKETIIGLIIESSLFRILWVQSRSLTCRISWKARCISCWINQVRVKQCTWLLYPPVYHVLTVGRPIASYRCVCWVDKMNLLNIKLYMIWLYMNTKKNITPLYPKRRQLCPLKFMLCVMLSLCLQVQESFYL